MSARGLDALDPLATVIGQIVRSGRAWQLPGCSHEGERNAQRKEAYELRLTLSRDPFASADSVDRRAVVGLRIQQAIRHADRVKQLRAKVRMAPEPAPLPHNVIPLSRRAL